MTQRHRGLTRQLEPPPPLSPRPRWQTVTLPPSEAAGDSVGLSEMAVSGKTVPSLGRAPSGSECCGEDLP